MLDTLARPALRAKEWHEAVAGLVADFPTTPGARPGTSSSSALPSGISAAKAASLCAKALICAGHTLPDLVVLAAQ